MLVVKRRKNESVIINGNITVMVTEIRNDGVRLGIDAPKEIPVHRSEVQDQINRNLAAGSKLASPEIESELASLNSQIVALQTRRQELLKREGGEA